ncbi:MAG: manganese efflux pump [Alphaproteobacteria bacterium]|nr:manganese efflux pump [Alphaproteobacteria bacterium]
MSLLSVIFLAFSMSTDAFAAALGKGATMRHPTLREALRVGAIFGITEGITPVIGWLLGRAAAAYITTFDHWIAFGLLVGIGGKMIWESFQKKEDVNPVRHSFSLLLLTAFGTSIDALAVGVTLALINANIVINAIAIGLAAFGMTTIGILAGKALGERFGRYAEVGGGLVLVAIGTGILLQHVIV